MGKINIFTQKVLYSGYSLDEVKRIAGKLKEHKIEYEVKEWNKRSSTGRNGGTFGELENYSIVSIAEGSDKNIHQCLMMMAENHSKRMFEQIKADM